MNKRKILSTTALALCFGVAGVGYVSGAVGVNSLKLRDAVTLNGVRAHQQALQAVADANGGIRASGSPGFQASLDYVKGQLDAAGYITTVQPFDFAFFEENSPSILQQTSPNLVDYVNGTDFATMSYSGAGDVTAVVQAVDLTIPATGGSTSGCEAADFAGFVPGNIALIQRGTCTFNLKAVNALAAGATAVIIFNEGNSPDRLPVVFGTLGTPVGLPVVGASYDLGVALIDLGGPTVRVATDTTSEIRSTSNLIAETPGGRDDRVVVVGAHLDSVTEGPGINDNGSGTAGILEIALQMANPDNKIKPRNKVRFAWWGAEESGLLGSEYYVAQLSKREIKNIAVNLNFDMIGSPNFVRQVYDGDGSDTGTAGPNGSSVIEDVFAKYFKSQDLTIEATAFDGRSDYGPFIAVGIPAGGLFTGAEEIKTPQQAALFGGTAGVALDPCYHLACDTFANNSNEALDQMSDAAADAVLQFAMTTSAVKGTSKANDAAVNKVKAESLLYKGGHLQK